MSSARNPTVPSSQNKTQSFIDLAYSEPEFSAVGRLDCIEEIPNTETSEVTPLGINFGPVEVDCRASGVYIGNGIVITAAHCVPSFVKNGEFISDLSRFWYFSIKDKDGNQTYSKVLRAIRHHDYIKDEKGLTTRGKNMSTDIAILQIHGWLENKTTPARLNYQSFEVTYHCIAFGFPNRKFIPRQEDNKRMQSDAIIPFDRDKISVKIPHAYVIQNTLENTIGYNVTKITSGDIELESRAYNLMESGIAGGMSGGGWFDVNKNLIGITSAAGPSDALNVPKHFLRSSRINKDRDWAAPIFANKSWLEQTIQTFKSEGPTFCNLDKDWYKQRAEYEAQQNSKCNRNYFNFGLFGNKSQATEMKASNKGTKLHSGPVPMFEVTKEKESSVSFPSSVRLG